MFLFHQLATRGLQWLLHSAPLAPEREIPSWHQYVRAPSDHIVRPVSIIHGRTYGNVTHPEALLAPGHGLTTFSAQPSQDLIPSVVVDFGQPVVGFLSIAFGGASTNSPGIRLAFSETLQYLSDVSDFSRSYNGQSITPGSDQIAVESNPYVWTDNYGCVHENQVCTDGLHGFRYVKISLDVLETDSPHTAPYGTVSIDNISLNFTAFLGTPDTFTGWFECSDVTLNRFWYNAAYTSEMCIDTFRVNDTEPRNAASESLVGKLVIHDGPKRDRDPYVGDIAVSGTAIYLTHNASQAAENVLADLADHQRSDGWIPPASIGGYTLPLFDYPLWWIIASFSLWQYTDADSYMLRYYSTMAKALNEFYLPLQDKNGLLVKGPRGTENYGDYAFLPRKGIVTYYNALYLLALQAASQVADHYGHYADSRCWETRASRVKQAINSHLWDPLTGAYLDSLTRITYGQDGNGLAMLAEVANMTQKTSILNFWSSLSLPHGNPFFSNGNLAPGSGFESRVYPFISTFEIASRFQTPGMGDSAIEQVKRMYGWMENNDPGTTFWEGIGEGGSMYEGGYTSAVHGWSTGVLAAMVNYILGVTPTSKGFGQWLLKPMPVGGVKWAKGVVPTPQGGFMVNWTTIADEYEFFMDFEVPPYTKGHVAVPVSDKSKVIVLNERKPIDTGYSGSREDLSRQKSLLGIARRLKQIGENQNDPPSSHRKEEWEVLEVIVSKIKCGELSYRISWEGHDEDLQWYPASDTKYSPKKLEETHLADPEQAGPPRNLIKWIRAWNDKVEDYNHLDDDTLMSTSSRTSFFGRGHHSRSRSPMVL